MFFLANEAATERFGKTIGDVAGSGDILVLSGELGAGKTTLTKGIALGLGITQMIKSPTYTIVREYANGRLPLYHMDIYRIESGADELGLEEYFEGDGLSVVEWGRQLGEDMPADYLELILAKDETDLARRKVELVAYGPQAARFKERIETAYEK